jgi:sulfoxide reductase heme-binding subunit YedZ
MKNASFAKLVVFVNSAVPLSLLAWDWSQNQLGTNPINFALRTLGMCALVFLVLTLAVTPLRLITGWNFLSNFRRQLGLWAFAYGVLHLTLYYVFDQSFDAVAVIRDVAKRPFILFGMTALLLMLPLALTSTTGSIKRLGAARWKRLHQLVYLSAIAAVTHFYMFVKADHRMPVAFISVLAALLLYRLLVKQFTFLRRTRKASANPTPA